ncbi:Phosphate import ATP-binding protein PstB 3 [bioreactor metagenome]|uniref:Phosphate import ATP-binding protein PstB 3 n=1 Tax=bioreactor metagenome TaxID=1076179 RepID=A0A644YHA6_9ZZZZ
MEASYVSIRNVSVWYGAHQVLREVSLEVPKNSITALIGPSGCGKTTLLRSVNRLNDSVKDFRLEGKILVGGTDIYARNDNEYVEALRRNIGMVFQHTNPLPMTILGNLLLPIREHTRLSRQEGVRLAEAKLRQTGLYDEVASRLRHSAMKLSGGQQQRMCIARALMLEPGLLLMDEPCSALDPISTFKVEELLLKLKEDYTIIIVTHNMEQAPRISDYTAFFYEGEIVEYGQTVQMFLNPAQEKTRQYLSGRF